MIYYNEVFCIFYLQTHYYSSAVKDTNSGNRNSKYLSATKILEQHNGSDTNPESPLPALNLTLNNPNYSGGKLSSGDTGKSFI